MNKIDKMDVSLYPMYNLPINGGNMQNVNGYQFYQVGTLIHPLTELKSVVKLSDVFLLFLNAKDWVRSRE